MCKTVSGHTYRHKQTNTHRLKIKKRENGRKRTEKKIYLISLSVYIYAYILRTFRLPVCWRSVFSRRAHDTQAQQKDKSMKLRSRTGTSRQLHMHIGI